MPQYHTDFWEALVAVIGETWADVKPNGIYRSRELARIDWEKQARQRGFPLCVVDMAPDVSGQYGARNRVEVVDTAIYRIVGPDDAEDAIALTESLEALRTVLWPDDRSVNPLDFGQVERYPKISDSMELPVNRLFLRAAIPCYSGAVLTRIIIGQQ